MVPVSSTSTASGRQYYPTQLASAQDQAEQDFVSSLLTTEQPPPPSSSAEVSGDSFKQCRHGNDEKNSGEAASASSGAAASGSVRSVKASPGSSSPSSGSTVQMSPSSEDVETGEASFASAGYFSSTIHKPNKHQQQLPAQLRSQVPWPGMTSSPYPTGAYPPQSFVGVSVPQAASSMQASSMTTASIPVQITTSTTTHHHHQVSSSIPMAMQLSMPMAVPTSNPPVPSANVTTAGTTSSQTAPPPKSSWWSNSQQFTGPQAGAPYNYGEASSATYCQPPYPYSSPFYPPSTPVPSSTPLPPQSTNQPSSVAGQQPSTSTTRMDADADIDHFIYPTQSQATTTTTISTTTSTAQVHMGFPGTTSSSQMSYPAPSSLPPPPPPQMLPNYPAGYNPQTPMMLPTACPPGCTCGALSSGYPLAAPLPPLPPGSMPAVPWGMPMPIPMPPKKTRGRKKKGSLVTMPSSPFQPQLMTAPRPHSWSYAASTPINFANSFNSSATGQAKPKTKRQPKTNHNFSSPHIGNVEAGEHDDPGRSQTPGVDSTPVSTPASRGASPAIMPSNISSPMPLDVWGHPLQIPFIPVKPEAGEMSPFVFDQNQPKRRRKRNTGAKRKKVQNSILLFHDRRVFSAGNFIFFVSRRKYIAESR